MNSPRLPDINFAREQSRVVRERIEREHQEEKESQRLERIKNLREKKAEKARRLETNRLRNQLVRLAIDKAATGSFVLEFEPSGQGLEIVLKNLGFHIETKSKVLKTVNSGLFDYWEEHSLPPNDFGMALKSLNSFLIKHIKDGLGNLFTKEEIKNLVDKLLKDYYSVVDDRFALASMLSRITKFELSIKKITPNDLIKDVARRSDFKSTAEGKLLETIPFEQNLYIVCEIASTILEDISSSDEYFEELALSISYSLEKELKKGKSTNLLLTWFRVPYLSELKIDKFAETLFWLASAQGQGELENIYKLIHHAINQGRSEVQYMMSLDFAEVKLGNVLKHFLRNGGYKVILNNDDNSDFELNIRWD